MKKTTFCLVLAAVLGLGACANLDGKSAYDLAKISRERMFGEDSSFNFQGEAKMYLSQKDKGVTPKSSDGMTQEKSKEQNETAEENTASMLVDLLQRQTVLARYLAGGKLRYQGAVDLSAQKIELIPELVLENHNEYSSLKMPVLVDGQEKSIVIDPPATVPLFASFFTDAKMKQRLVGGQLKLKADDTEALKGIPLQHALKALVLAFYRANDVLPKEAFTLQPMDEFGQQHHARYRVQFVLTDAYEKLLDQETLKLFDRELAALQKKPEAGSTSEGYQQVREFIRTLLEDAEGGSMEKMLGSPLYTDYYLDRKGRILASRDYVQINGKHTALNLIADSVFYNYGKPVFSFKPDAAKIITPDELVKAFSREQDEE